MGHGGMSCGLKAARLILVLFNIVFFLVGAALLALGIYVMVDPKFQRIKEFLPISSNPGVEKGLSYLEVMGIVVIVLGSILLIVGFLGCCGAMQQVKLFLVCYAIIVGIIIAIEIGVTVYFVAFQSKFRTLFVPKLQNSIRDMYEGPLGLKSDGQPKPSPVSLAWDFIMFNFKCCGAEGKSDFDQATKWNRTKPTSFSRAAVGPDDLKYPLMCCPFQSVSSNWKDLPLGNLHEVTDCAMTGNGVYEIGCYDKLIELLNSAKTWVIVAAVVILIFELCAFIFTLALCCRNGKETIYYSS